ncbi:trypsin V-B-like [Daphnia carinata]|uniref:trypsin V-B-like n=1 Tax=Daphnia carinata TaxID=120202 RepID=UPI00257EFBBA|nr:trypsin V-B-like [Daphnia carinata]
MRILLAISFLNVITAFKDETAASRILQGVPAAIGEFPYVVAIKVDDKFRCGGFIYNERWVVTVASCVNGFNNVLDRVTVEAGIVSLKMPEPSQQLIRIESFHLYDSYNESLTGPLHDLALIQTRLPFTFNSEVNFSYYDETSREMATFIGWGVAEVIGDGGSYSNELRKAMITVNSTICQSAYGTSYQNAYMICTGDADAGDTQSPCQYDEGSPLVQNGYVVGVMSRNSGCDASGTVIPTIYTRLSVYYNWMVTTAGIQPLPSLVQLDRSLSEPETN